MRLFVFRFPRNTRILTFLCSICLCCSAYVVIMILINRWSDGPSNLSSSVLKHRKCFSREQYPASHIAGGNDRINTGVILVLTSKRRSEDLHRAILYEIESSDFRYVIAEANSERMVEMLRNYNGTIGPILFESYWSYLSLDSSYRLFVDNYCRTHRAGIVSFLNARTTRSERRENSSSGAWTVVSSDLSMSSVSRVKGMCLNASSPILYVTKPNGKWRGKLRGDYFTVLTPAKSGNSSGRYSGVLSTNAAQHSVSGHTVLHDTGTEDGIERVLFGVGSGSGTSGNNVGAGLFWLQRLLLLDALMHTSGGRLKMDLTRYILVDIDDMFISSPLVNFTSQDVQALLKFQHEMRRLVAGFTLNLGFSGGFYDRSTAGARSAHDLLLENAEQFWWFPHSFNHRQPHMSNESNIHADMLKNHQFAEHHNLPVCHQYAVSSHHSGIYPVDSTLYESWKKIWNIQYSSTEEYPHLNQWKPHRGFIHQGIHVLPRFTCGIFTHTIYLDRYPGGKDRLFDMIDGGSLFSTIVKNPVSVFMTHQPNYAGDRLALITWSRVLRFLAEWTNIRPVCAPPPLLADIYFSRFSEHRSPIWTNPCDDRRHIQIWRRAASQSTSQHPPVKSNISSNDALAVAKQQPEVCRRVPSLLILGPQKTGSTALHKFLRAHPLFAANKATERTFEEMQFFSNSFNYYNRGVEWYLDHFVSDASFPSNSSSRTIWFEKSATYFDSIEAPVRAASFLPRAILVVLLDDPVRRAHSWYQHCRAHGLPAAMDNSFSDILHGSNKGDKSIRSLRNRCLEPGKYVIHIRRWLRHFRASQMYFVDSSRLTSRPVEEMSALMRNLRIKSNVGFSQLLKFNRKKGFYCLVRSPPGLSNCLGAGKGRVYPALSEETVLYLQRYYMPYNEQLYDLLINLKRRIPDWLQSIVSGVNFTTVV